MSIVLRDLHSIDEYRQVVDLEREIWGYTDTNDLVTLPVFIITMKRGGILIGAFDASERMVGFVYSIVGLKAGRPIHWSHMLGVLPAYRSGGLGRTLKLAQRERALAAGVDLMEWTFDPLQALNAHLNFTRLGVVSDEYARNVYGESTSALHKGTPTDRLIVQWRISEPLRAEGHAPRLEGHPSGWPQSTAPVINRTEADGDWIRVSAMDLNIDAPHVVLEIPTAFSDLQQRAPELALDWRLRTREAFETYLGRGHLVADFALDRANGRGRYLLSR